MLPVRRSAAAATSFRLIAGGCLALLLAMAQSPAAAASVCTNAAEITVLPSPMAPWTGAPLRVMVVAEKPVEGMLSLTAPDGSVAVKPSGRRGGPPYSWFAEVAAPA